MDVVLFDAQLKFGQMDKNISDYFMAFIYTKF